jgi:hypothetical protein
MVMPVASIDHHNCSVSTQINISLWTNDFSFKPDGQAKIFSVPEAITAKPTSDKKFNPGILLPDTAHIP